MSTITLKINERNKAGKALKALIDALAGNEDAVVEIIKEDKEVTYNPDFVKKIKDSYANDKRTKINTNDLWENI